MKFRWMTWVLALTVAGAVAGCNREEAPATTENPSQAAQPSTAQRDDASITTSVQAKYYADDDIRGRDIRVVTDSGVVTLSGTVESETARDRAVSLARDVQGVTRVEDQLRVATASADPATRPGPTEQPAGTSGRETAVTPGWITTKIQAQYFASAEVKPWNVDVTTSNNGVVTLEGEVETAEDKAEAVRIAKTTEGVTRVEDRLRVKGEAERTETKPGAGITPVPGIERPDAWLTAKIQSKYFLDDEVKGHEINVTTNDSVVTLEGTIENEAQRRQAIALARNTEGVKDVVDRLTVSPDQDAPATKDPAERADRDVDMKRPDEWITMKVQSKYFLDATVKGRNIDVTTKSGVVTLTGTVTSDAEKKQAEQIARSTEGVARVVNQLKISAAPGDGV